MSTAAVTWPYPLCLNRHEAILHADVAVVACSAHFSCGAGHSSRSGYQGLLLSAATHHASGETTVGLHALCLSQGQPAGASFRLRPFLSVMQEQEAFAAAASLDTHKALVHIFFAQRATKKVTGVTDAGLKPRKVRKLAVLGGGLMGSGIATAGLLAGQEVLIKEVNEKFMEVTCSACPSHRTSLTMLLNLCCSAMSSRASQAKLTIDGLKFVCGM